MINVGQSLKEHREKTGLSQSELARRTHIKQANISRWENGTHFPNILDCITLASFYDISIDYLIGYENEDGSKNTNIVNSFNNVHNSGNITIK